MIRMNRARENFILQYPLEKYTSLDSVLFFDIETTGFLARSSNLYLIGCAYYTQNLWNIRQWFAETPKEETLVLNEFLSFAEQFTTLVHFNGNQFDLPYLKQKCEQHGITHHLDEMQGIDIYKRISPYKALLKLPNCKQKTLEHFLGIHREDQYTGGELIEVYKNYCRHPLNEYKDALLLHNFEDICGMLDCLPILKYTDVLNQPVTVHKVQANKYADFQGNMKRELIMFATLGDTVPVPVLLSKENVFLRMEENTCQIKVPIYDGELKYYYANFKDYYYLPQEDMALHKSIAGYVEKAYRQQAQASNCYTRKTSAYLPQWDVTIEPFFKKDYKDPQTYFELTEELKKDREAFSNYANHILSNVFR